MKAPDGESFLDPRSVYCVFSRRLSVEALNENLRQRFMQLTDSRDPKRIVIPLVDAVMSGGAMFTLTAFCRSHLDNLLSPPRQGSSSFFGF